jgi:hypothetical protein
METLPAIRETRCCEDRLRGQEREDDAREFLREKVMLVESGEFRPLIGVRGLDGIGDWMGEYERGSAVLDTTDERREIAGDEGWDIWGGGEWVERVITAGGSQRKKRSGSELDVSGEGAAKKSSEVS